MSRLLWIAACCILDCLLCVRSPLRADDAPAQKEIPTIAQAAQATSIEAVLLHPLFDAFYVCTEHWADQLPSLGDALGTDCHIQQLEDVNGRLWLRSYRGEGLVNEDWYGWAADVLSPCDCMVEKISINAETNTPGIMGEGRASFVLLGRADGVKVLVAHVSNIKVEEGQRVTAGQTIAQVGNNGFSRHPHIHIGAWRDQTPLQIRFDQTQMQRAQKNQNAQ